MLDYFGGSIAVWLGLLSLLVAGWATDRRFRIFARRTVIQVAEFCVFFAMAATTLGAARIGHLIGGAFLEAHLKFGASHDPNLYPAVGALLGGVVGFVSAALVFSFFFLLHEIAENTRKVE